MRKSRFSKTRIGHLAAGLVVALASVSFAAYVTFGSIQPEVLAESDNAGSTAVIAAEPPTGTESDAEQSPSAPAVLADELPSVPVPDTAGKGPGLASPLPSPLETAASTLAAKYPGRTVKIGVQAGHWKAAEQPDELASLRKNTGAAGPGWREVDVNLDVSRKIAGVLSPFGIQVELLPATVPVDYKADAFVAIHGDANSNKSLSGFKIARATGSVIPQKDDALVAAITDSYKDATGLSWHASTITQNMRRYYAFNQKLQHSVDPGTPSVIVELGFFTNPSDLEIVTNQTDRVAESIALGILNFLVK